MSELITFIRDNISDDLNLLSTISNNTNKPEFAKLVEAYSEYMRKYRNDKQLRKDTDDFRKLANAVQAFYQLVEEEEEEDEIKINLDDDTLDADAVNDDDAVNDNYSSLILNNEEDLDEMLFPNDPFGQDYNYLDSIVVNDRLLFISRCSIPTDLSPLHSAALRSGLLHGLPPLDPIFKKVTLIETIN